MIVLHGIAGKGERYVDGVFGPGVEMAEYASKPFLEGAGVEAGTRVVCASSGTTTNPAMLAMMQAGGIGDGATPQPSWFDQMKDMRDPESPFFDTTAPDAVKTTAYVQSLIRDQIKRGVKAERVFVLGHSQGGCVGSRAVFTFQDATLGGLVMLSAWHAWTDLEQVASDAQRGKLKIFAAHSHEDRIAPYPCLSMRTLVYYSFV